MHDPDINAAGHGPAHAPADDNVVNASRPNYSEPHDLDAGAPTVPYQANRQYPILPPPWSVAPNLPALSTAIAPANNAASALPTPPSQSENAFSPLFEWHAKEQAESAGSECNQPLPTQHAPNQRPHFRDPASGYYPREPQWYTGHARGFPYQPPISPPQQYPAWSPSPYNAAPRKLPPLVGHIPQLSSDVQEQTYPYGAPQDPIRPIFAHEPEFSPMEGGVRSLPPIQNWPVGSPRQQPGLSYVDGIAAATHHSNQVQQGTSTQHVAPSDQVSKRRLDKRSLRKQEAYRRKAEEKKRPISDGSAGSKAPKPRASNAAKANDQDGANARIQDFNRSIRRKRLPGTQQLTQPTCPPGAAAQNHAHEGSPYADAKFGPYASTPPSDIPAYVSPYDHGQVHFGQGVLIPSHTHQPMPYPPAPRQPTWDDFEQAIVADYDQYKWSVRLYQVDTAKTGYDFAQSWLEDQFTTLDFTYRWAAHTSYGFVKGGDRLTFLVLHNAANPFQLGGPPQTTTSIGVYGCYWYEHSEIHWKTFAPGLRSLIERVEAAGLIKEVQKWHIGMKATEKRFHRAYWLCANRIRLGNLLPIRLHLDAPHNGVEDDVDDFQVTEADLSNHWADVSYEDTLRAWEYVLDEASKPPPKDCDHVATWSTEW
ncbi:hypothetical protein BU26DRAFT_315921 [Trematosphaeria pertusa]|uniref:Uncharacterized protein n=1 Tax=Trematosphaeria pertusa TaxID=390896 RepID=A0A6A6IHD2_9PLEO|nr:uncharacterized protein BU26DRAFT_315921 [Trematosphaeria pertusa]KAF2249292.1 hypothetical protein BU26DRAFT_315921 [Trematosphaeria pertusa]